MSFNIGDTVGDYQIIGLLGAGGMGKVYKVKNQISDRVDAMKVLLPNLADDPELADRFIREIKVLASLNHPNIAGLRTAFRLDNQLLMVMEYVEGTTLDDRCKMGAIPVDESINYISQALSALGYAHKHGVIHRDIKPANMMLTPEGFIKLMDFGIAKSKSDKKLTQTGTTMGSLFYMSAEQVQGGELDGRSDLYSIGVSLYEMVTGTRPFQGKSDFDIMVAQLQQIPMAPMQMMPNLPRALNDVIMTSLEKDPARRFQTAEDFAAALAGISGSLQSTPMQGAVPVGAPPSYDPATAQRSATGMMGAQVPPAPPTYTQAMPIGGAYRQTGSMPTAMAPQPTPTGSLPTVMAPQPTPTGSLPTVMAPQPPAPQGYGYTGSQPAVAPPPPPGYAYTGGLPAVPQAMPPGPAMVPPAMQPPVMPMPGAPKSSRGLFMALGALVVIAVLVAAAVMVPRILKTHANGDQTAPASVISTSPTPPSAPNTTPDNAQSSISVATAPSPNAGGNEAFTPGGGSPGASSPVGAAAAGNTPAPVANPGGGNPPNHGGGHTPRVTNGAPQNQISASSAVAPTGQVAPAGGGQATPAPAGPDPATAQQLAELGELHDKLAVRAQSANDGVEQLRKQMASSGNNLRDDIGSSQTRMRMYMDKFDQAMNAKDPVAANKYMHLAEAEVDKLESFLGQ